MAQSVTVKYTPTQQDYAQVLRLIMLRSIVNQILIGFLVLGFVFILFNLVTQATPISIFALIWLLLPPLFIIYIIFFQPNRMAKQYMNNEQLATEYTWEVNDSGVKISTSFGSNQLEWDSLSRLLPTKDYYLLYIKKSRYAPRFLPRRAFTSAEEQDAFLQMMTSHLSK
jgi:YcxB-like protein